MNIKFYFTIIVIIFIQNGCYLGDFNSTKCPYPSPSANFSDVKDKNFEREIKRYGNPTSYWTLITYINKKNSIDEALRHSVLIYRPQKEIYWWIIDENKSRILFNIKDRGKKFYRPRVKSLPVAEDNEMIGDVEIENKTLGISKIINARYINTDMIKEQLPELEMLICVGDDFHAFPYFFANGLERHVVLAYEDYQTFIKSYKSSSYSAFLQGPGSDGVIAEANDFNTLIKKVREIQKENR